MRHKREHSGESYYVLRSRGRGRYTKLIQSGVQMRANIETKKKL